jgi:hypothetical protein
MTAKVHFQLHRIQAEMVIYVHAGWQVQAHARFRAKGMGKDSHKKPDDR